MSITSEFNVEKVNSELPTDWKIQIEQQDSLIKIESKSVPDYFLTVQKWNEMYIVIPYDKRDKEVFEHNDKQIKQSKDIMDVFYHATLLIHSWT